MVTLVGRADECRILDELTAAVRAGHSRAMVLVGDPGIGKTALLGHVVTGAGDTEVLRATGIRVEADLPFAGLHQLVGSMDERIESLPAPQRKALRVAFGSEDGDAPEPYVVGLGVLHLLAGRARQRPVLCVVDDEQWLDRATVLVLSFVARRVEAAVGFVFASRRAAPELDGVPALVLAGLSAHHAGELLDSALTGPLDPSVRNQIVAETHGNPLALLDLPRGVAPAELAGGFRFPGALPMPERAEAAYRAHLDALTGSARQFLLLAAADPIGDPTTLWSAAARLGLDPFTATQALASGLVTIGARVEFRHPLARTAVYRAAGLEQRRAVHDALAAVTDPGSDPDRRAWHRAHAAPGPDEETAAELERSADRARARGGLAAAAAFLEQAATLTADPRARVRRLLCAAEAARDSGSLDAALALLDGAGLRALDELDTARLMRIRGLIAIERHGRAEAVGLLLGAAARFAAAGAPEARETTLEALVSALYDAESHDELVARTVTAVADTACRPADPVTLTDLLLRGLYLRVTEGFAAAAPTLRRALHVMAEAPTGRRPAFGAFRLMAMLPIELWDEPAWGALATRLVAVCRREGALGVLPAVLNFAAFHRLYQGDFFAAGALLDEADAVAVVTTGSSNRYTELVVRAWRGDAAGLGALRDQLGRQLAGTAGPYAFCAGYAEAVLANGLGQFDVAFEAAKRVFEAGPTAAGSAVVSELLDAASRTGDTAELRTVRDWLAARATAAPGPWVSGIHERSLALLAPEDSAEHHYLESIWHLTLTGARLELARSYLLFGEWLRRRGRRADARPHLRQAQQTFQELGAEGFARRAARELQATGDGTARIAEKRHEALTAQEAQIASLASTGLSNPEIGIRLFISRRTVQYHLRKVFLKLDISSRAQLRLALRDTDLEVALA
ncbi:AAA family ATPase [Actinoplanes sp. NPDC020271]|uniref:AAA family ATPase n=1 Tax=Actinoplanes sp. NPDC020271 TaxID=3363896 RepID=UPI0037A13737